MTSHPVSFPDLARAMVASHSVIFALWVLFPHNPGFLTFPRLHGNHRVVGHRRGAPPNQDGYQTMGSSSHKEGDFTMLGLCGPVWLLLAPQMPPRY